jgi:energy-coupling factor transport system substrate-specific component
MTGRMANWGFFKSWWKVAVTGFVVALTAAVTSTPIAVYLYGGITASGSSFITAYLLQTGQGVLQAVLSTSFITEPVDKITTAMLAFAILQGLSNRFLARFPRSENASTQQSTRTELYIAIGVIVVLILFAAFMLRLITGG